MPVFHNENAQTKFVSTYSIDNSLRFDQGSSSYMSWVPSSAGNEKTFTFSCWIKLGNDFGTHRNLWNYADNVGSDPRGAISINNDNMLFLGSNPTGSTWHEATSKFLFKDPTAWYHICVAYDTTSATSAHRTRVYINGEEIDHSTGFNSTSSFPISQNSNTGFNYTYQHVIGVYEAGNTSFFDGLLSDVYIVDGTQLAPSDFTETNEEGQLIPKEYTGSLGTNGGHYLFNDTAGSQVFTDSSGTAFTDSSSSAHAITVNGDTHHSRTQKKVDASSMYFDGSGDYITTPTTTFDMDGDFTIEAWVYASTLDASSSNGIMNLGSESGAADDGWLLSINSDERLSLHRVDNGSWTSITGSATLTTGSWYHVAAVRSSGSIQLYINGVADGSPVSNTDDWSFTYKFQVGTLWNDRSSNSWEGYIDEVRVSNSARYTSGFGSTISDSSSSDHTITANGDTHHSYTTSKVGDSSMYFDGSGDYITTPTTTFDMDGDFTIEAWVYTTSAVPASSTRGILNMGPDTWPVNGGWNLYCTHTPNNAIVFDWYNSSNTNISTQSSTQLSLNTWYHVAVVRSGSTVQIYIDGSADGSSTSNSDDLGVTHKFQVGSHWNDRSTWQWEGYIDEVRVSNSARYTSGFTPSTTAFTSDSNTLLLIHSPGDGAAVPTDAFESDSNTLLLIHSDGTKHTISNQDNTTHTKAQKKIGSSSIYLDGSGDYLEVPASSDFDFGTGEFTIEAWIYRTGSTNDDTIWGNGVAESSAGCMFFFDSNGELRVRAADYSTSNEVVTTSSAGISTGAWHHVALVRSSDNLKIYVGGVDKTSGGTDVTGSSFGSSSQVNRIGGRDSDTAYNFEGYIDEFRISDSARYTSSFTPSTAAFESDNNTILLVHSDWGGGLGGDSSTNGNDFSVVNMNDHDQMIDSPSPGKNFATFNPVAITNTGQTLSEGNLKHNRSGNWLLTHTTMAMTSGKWYAELYFFESHATGAKAGKMYTAFGVIKTEGNQVQNANTGNNGYVGKYSDGWGHWQNGDACGSVHNGSDDSSYGTMGSLDDIWQIAFNADTGVIWFGRNGTWFESATAAEIAAGTTTNAAHTGISTSDEYYFASGSEDNATIWNFGQDGTFAGNHSGTLVTGGGGEWAYAPPDGFGALKTDNLPEPAHNNAKTKAFNTTIYTGTGSSNSITTGHEVDLIWIKRRSSSNSSHVTDSVRWDKTNATDLTYAAWTPSQVDSLDSNGYTVDGGGAAANDSGSTYVGWSWKAGGTAVSNTSGNITSSVSANTSAGFSIAKYTGVAYDVNSGNHTVGHGLGVAPEMVIIKSLGDGGGNYETDWVVWHKDLYETTGYLILNSDVSEQGPEAEFFRSAPTSTVVNIGSNAEVSDNNDGAYPTSTWDDYIMYSFASKDGHCKVGSYTGNGSTDGPMIHTGFKVGWIMIKSLDQEEWHIMDSKRDTINPNTAILRADESTAEGNFGGGMDFLASGVKLRESGGAVNNSNYPYIYLALSDNPFKYAIAR